MSKFQYINISKYSSMAKIPLYNMMGAAAGEIELSDAVFGVKVTPSVVHQVYTALTANLRGSWAHTKDRGDVRGGGKKPWRQKGTGRARHGSIRSPIWKGGGVTFGPLSTRNYKQKINKKMNQTAMRMCLSDRTAEGRMVAVEDFPREGKTKPMVALRAKLPGAGKSTLLIVAGQEGEVARAMRNIPKMSLVRAADVNVADVLEHQYLVGSKTALEFLASRLGKKAKA
jgi:large subunit ribosomal protein L4